MASTDKPVEWVFIDWENSALTIRQLMALFSSFHPEDIRLGNDPKSDTTIEIDWAGHEVELTQGSLVVFHRPNWLFVFKPDDPHPTATILRDESREPFSDLFGGF